MVGGDEGMLTKKPLGPAGNCLACDKLITKMGGVSEYRVWKKLPKEQAER